MFIIIIIVTFEIHIRPKHTRSFVINILVRLPIYFGKIFSQLAIPVRLIRKYVLGTLHIF